MKTKKQGKENTNKDDEERKIYRRITRMGTYTEGVKIILRKKDSRFSRNEVRGWNMKSN